MLCNRDLLLIESDNNIIDILLLLLLLLMMVVAFKNEVHDTNCIPKTITGQQNIV